MDDEGSYAISLLTEELQADDAYSRAKAIYRVKTVAMLLGPEKTREELLPLLTKSNQDEDEVLVALAEQLGQLIPCIGGDAYASILLPELEILAEMEETVVRDKAVE